MRRFLIIAITITFAAVAFNLWRKWDIASLSSYIDIPSTNVLYPFAPALPPAVSTPIEDLLAEYEVFLQAKAPSVFNALQPGLSEVQLDELEQKYGIKLTSDLRALYRWRNGVPRSANIDAFPSHEFIPLDAALANREALRQEVASSGALQRLAHSQLAGHREPWVGVIVDLAGDGYYYDPERAESQGSFFFCFCETADYVFFPAFRNYLAAVNDGIRSGHFTPGAHGIETNDFEQAHQLWQQYGTEATP